MSTAVTPPVSAAPTPVSERSRLLLASVFGAIVVLGGLAVAGYVVPTVWEKNVAPMLGKQFGFLNVALRLAVQVAAAAAVIWTGTRLAGERPPKGLRGGIFLVISLVIAVFYVVRAIGLNLETVAFGPMITGGLGVVVLFFAVRFLLGGRANRWMVDLEHAGWFHTHSYKQTQGVALRRYTLVGVLVLGLSGVWGLIAHQSIQSGELALSVPFTGPPHFLLPILPAADLSIPLLLAAATLWFGWRLVNVPAFADFLINTEAEMNKVSWSSKRQLYRDTIVVLVTVLLLTLFLLVIDLFWGWLLSREIIHVLPSSKPAEAGQQNNPSDTPPW